MHVLDVMKVIEDAVDRDVDVIDLDFAHVRGSFSAKRDENLWMKRDTLC